MTRKDWESYKALYEAEVRNSGRVQSDGFTIEVIPFPPALRKSTPPRSAPTEPIYKHFTMGGSICTNMTKIMPAKWTSKEGLPLVGDTYDTSKWPPPMRGESLQAEIEDRGISNQHLSLLIVHGLRYIMSKGSKCYVRLRGYDGYLFTYGHNPQHIHLAIRVMLSRGLVTLSKIYSGQKRVTRLIRLTQEGADLVKQTKDLADLRDVPLPPEGSGGTPWDGKALEKSEVPWVWDTQGYHGHNESDKTSALA